ncbi:MAG: methyltransferase domain-containing protein [Acidobacteria bacterium]|nr:methyltransferase domain-containing protein [Acidobacteriota bacterium]
MKLLMGVAGAAVAVLAGFGGWSLWLLKGSPDDIDRLARELGVGAGAVVADVGAGSGSWAVRLAEIVGPGGRVYATELPGRLDGLRELARSEAGDTLVVVEAGPTATGLDPACCDAIVMRGVYHHFDDGAEMSRQLLVALRPAGRLAIVDFAPDGPWRWHFWFLGRSHGGRRGHGAHLAEIARDAEAAGGRVVRQVAGWSGGYHLTVVERPE